MVGFILGVIGAFARADGPCSACAGGVVLNWANSVASPTGVSAWLENSSLPALGVALALTVLTLIVEYVLLVQRVSR